MPKPTLDTLEDIARLLADADILVAPRPDGRLEVGILPWHGRNGLTVAGVRLLHACLGLWLAREEVAVGVLTLRDLTVTLHDDGSVTLALDAARDAATLTPQEVHVLSATLDAWTHEEAPHGEA